MANVKYNEEIAARIIAAIGDGATQNAASRMVGITAETLSIWKKTYPPFGEAVERAHAEAQVFVEQSVHRMAIKGNVNAQIFWLKTRHPAIWHDVPAPQSFHKADIRGLGSRIGKTACQHGTSGGRS